MGPGRKRKQRPLFGRSSKMLGSVLQVSGSPPFSSGGRLLGLCVGEELGQERTPGRCLVGQHDLVTLRRANAQFSLSS